MLITLLVFCKTMYTNSRISLIEFKIFCYTTIIFCRYFFLELLYICYYLKYYIIQKFARKYIKTQDYYKKGHFMTCRQVKS